jgi:hypothetical protein
MMVATVEAMAVVKETGLLYSISCVDNYFVYEYAYDFKL